jgi:hypothetical protein
MNGSFFNLGLTNSWTKASCELLHMLRSSASNRCFSASFISAKIRRRCRACHSSCSAAVLQSGAFLLVGLGLGAGVGGLAGAEGRTCFAAAWWPPPSDTAIGLVGVCIARGGEARELVAMVAEVCETRLRRRDLPRGKTGCGEENSGAASSECWGGGEVSMSESESDMGARPRSSVAGSLLLRERGSIADGVQQVVGMKLGRWSTNGRRSQASRGGARRGRRGSVCQCTRSRSDGLDNGPRSPGRGSEKSTTGRERDSTRHCDATKNRSAAAAQGETSRTTGTRADRDAGESERARRERGRERARSSGREGGEVRSEET